MASLLSIRDLEKRFDSDGPAAVNGVSLDVHVGEILALLGPSGCGKTTTLRLIAGFERPDRGEVILRGEKISASDRHVPPERRRVGLVFQDFALFPHLTVLDNVSFGLKNLPSHERRARTRPLLDLFGLRGLEDRYPHHLSGGQQQRVAVARTLATQPDLILMDEPFSNLDALRRQSTRLEIREILKGKQATTILVTHDQEEALSFADRVAVMRNGRIEQVGAPEDIYHEPRTLFVAQFLGRTNLITCRADGTHAHTPLGRVPLNRGVSGEVLVAIRPEHVRLEAAGERSGQPEGTITEREFRGHDITYRIAINGIEFLAHTDNSDSYAPGERVVVQATGRAVVLEKESV